MVLFLWFYVFDYGCVVFFDMSRCGFYWVLIVDVKWRLRRIKRGGCVINLVI